AWASKLGGGTYAPAADDAAARATAADTAVAAKPDDPTARLEQAEATLGMAPAPRPVPGGPARHPRFTRLLFEDAERSAQAAQKLGAKGPRLEAVLALCAFHQERWREAYEHAVAGVAAVQDQQNRVAAAVLALFAEARQEAIVAAVRKKE